MILARILSTPAQGLRALTAEVTRATGCSWATARAQIAEASGVGLSGLAEVERGAVLTLDDLTHLRAAGGLVQRFDTGSIGYRAGGEFVESVERAVEGGSSAPRYRFVMSSATPDRAQDIVEQDWDLSGFNANPIAPLNHASWQLPIGRWHDVSVVGGRLQGDFAPYVPRDLGAYDGEAVTVADMLSQGILRAVSVGFLPRRAFSRASLDQSDPRYSPRGYVFAANELLECSIVTVPMNAEATMSAAPKRSDECEPETEIEPLQGSKGFKWGRRP